MTLAQADQILGNGYDSSSPSGCGLGRVNHFIIYKTVKF